MDQEWHFFGVMGWAATMMAGVVALLLGVHPASVLVAQSVSSWAAPTLVQPLTYGALLLTGIWLLSRINRWWRNALNFDKRPR